MLRSRSTLPTLALLTLAACGSSEGGGDSTGPAPERFSATLAGTSVVPATTSTNTGSVTFSMVPGDSILKFELSVGNMSGITQAHLHTAAAGANGNVLAWLLPVNGNNAQPGSVALTGVISLGDIAPSWIRGTPRLAMDSVVALMRAGRTYVDLHSTTSTNGELRGQVARVP
jgi:hypothetical protein